MTSAQRISSFGDASWFGDALNGPDGTADPVAAALRPEVFTDPTAELVPARGVPAAARTAAPAGLGVATPPVAPPSAGPAEAERARALQAARARAASQRTAPQRAAQPAPSYQRAQPRPTPAQTPAAIPPAGMVLQVGPGVAPATGPAPFPPSMQHPGTPQFPFAPQPGQPVNTVAAFRQVVQAARQAAAQGQPPARHPAPPPTGRPAPRPQTARPTKKSGGAWGVIGFLIFLLLATGIGQNIIKAITELFHR